MALWDNVNLTRISEWGPIRKALFGIAASVSLVGVPALFAWVVFQNDLALPNGPRNLQQQPHPVDFAVPKIHPEIDCVAALDAYATQTTIFFGTNSVAIGQEYHEFVFEVSNQLETCKNAEILLVGHADGTGSDSLNTDISIRRAEAFLSVLAANDRPTVRYRVFGQGARESVLLGDSGMDDQQLNRRLQLEVKYIDKLLKP